MSTSKRENTVTRCSQQLKSITNNPSVMSTNPHVVKIKHSTLNDTVRLSSTPSKSKNHTSISNKKKENAPNIFVVVENVYSCEVYHYLKQWGR